MDLGPSPSSSGNNLTTFFCKSNVFTVMNWATKELSFLLKPNQFLQWRTLVKVRLKWAKSRTLDNVIDTQTDLKAAYLLKDAILRTSGGYLTSKSIADWHKLLGLTIPTLRFIRRYPTLFHEFSHPRYPSLPCFRLTDIALNLHDQELRIFETHEAELVERLSKILMMSRNQMVPFQSLYSLRWDLGLPDDFDRNLIRKYPDCFGVVKTQNGLYCLQLLQWNDEYAVSVLEKGNENVNLGDSGRNESENEFKKFRRGKSPLAFSLRFPKGYGGQKKVKAWMEEFHKLPYISPYEDSTGIDMRSDLMEKRIVGLLHEFLSLTVHKMTKRNYIGSLRDEFNLPERFTRLYTRYPGIFYLSMKCKTTTVLLREGCSRGKLAKPSPLAKLREKFYNVMRTGLIYQNKGVHMLQQLDGLSSGDGENSAEVEEEYVEGENDETGKNCLCDGSSELDDKLDY